MPSTTPSILTRIESTLEWDDWPVNGPSLSIQHRGELVASAITPHVALARGYRTFNDAPGTRKVLKSQGFARYQTGPCLAIPTHRPNGTPGPWMIKRDQPRLQQRHGKEPKPRKYEMPVGQPLIVDCHPFSAQRIDDPTVRLWVTEGVKKGDSLVSQNEVALSLFGVWNFRGKNAKGGSTTLADFEYVALDGREVLMAFDLDFTRNKSVYGALERLSALLKRRGAKVLFTTSYSPRSGFSE